MARMKRGGGFTMVEVIIVIAIIVCLAAILLPVLARAREQARRVKCISNVRTLAMAWLAYAADNERMTCGGGKPWLGPGAGSVDAGRAAVHAGVLWPYVNDEKAYVCPDDVSLNNTRSSYMMNSFVAGGIKLDNLTQPAKTFVFIEACTNNPFAGGMVLTGTTFPAPGYPSVMFNGLIWPGENHQDPNTASGGCGISFADGHAIFWQYVDQRTGLLMQESGTPRYNGARGAGDLFQLEAWSGGPVPPGFDQ